MNMKMSFPAAHLPRIIARIVRFPRATVALLIAATLVICANIGRLEVVIDPDDTLPQSHPFLMTTNALDAIFGNKFMVVVGITPEDGDALQPAVLERVRAITRTLENDPGVVRANLLSLSARKVKAIEGSADGIAVTPLADLRDGAAIDRAVRDNSMYEGIVLSKDRRTAAVMAEFRKEAGGFRAIAARVEAAVAPHRAPGIDIRYAGQPIFLALVETFSDRMAILLPLAILVIGLIHFEAFRSWQGMILPLVTAQFAVAWSLGAMSWLGIPLDAFNATTPILVLAVAAGHAVQILKRYYERYEALRAAGEPATRETNRRAIVEGLAAVGPVMVAAGLIAAISFASLMVFEIKTIRTFGILTAIGIVSAVIIELTLIPAIRSLLPPPADRIARPNGKVSHWDRAAAALTGWLLRRRRKVVAVGLVFFLAMMMAGAGIRVDNSLRSYFSASLGARIDDAVLNQRLSGNNSLYLLIEGKADDAIKDPAVLRAMRATQAFLDAEPSVGKTLSIVDFIRRIDQTLAPEPPSPDGIPDSAELVGQYLLLYSMSGGPGDFDALVDYGYRRASIAAFLKEENSPYLTDLDRRLKAFAARTFPPGITINVGGNVMSPVALNEVIVGHKLLNIAQICAVVFVVSSLVFRSAVAGALVLVPLLVTIATIFGTMALCGIPLQVATATVAALAVGIGADYGIYLLYRLREELAAGDGEAAALERTMKGAGKAVIFVATAVAGGYAVLLASHGFLIHTWLAILIGIAMLASAISSLTLFMGLLMMIKPKAIFRTAILPVVALLLALPSTAGAAELSLPDIMARNFLVTKVADSEAEAVFVLENASGGQRVRNTLTQTRLLPNGTDTMRLTRFTAPPDVKGTATLTVEHTGADDDIWVYLPALKKVRRLAASNKKDAYVGTDFTYGDIIGYRVEEWTHSLLRTETVDGTVAHVVESVAKDDTVRDSTGYSRRTQWIATDSLVTVRGQFFDTGGRLVKEMKADDIRKVDDRLGRYQPMRIEMRNLDTGHRTEIRLNNYRANVGLGEDLFTPRALERN